MKCPAPKSSEQRAGQCLYVTNIPLMRENSGKQIRNLAKTQEVVIKTISCPGTSEQGLLATAEPINKSQPQKMICLNSINHNFQKHAVVTIKKLTKNIDSAFGNGHIDMLAHRMWNVFLTSGLKSKQILVILFRAANMSDQRYKELLKRCYFGQLCGYGQETIRSAQNLLRQRVASLLSEQRVRRNIQECRHIKNREAFYHYFMEFAQNLKKGPLTNFRINGQTSHRISQRMNTYPPIIRDQTQKRVKNRMRKMK